MENQSLEDICRRLANRKLRLEKLIILKAPHRIIEREKTLIEKSKLELRLAIKAIELETYEAHLLFLDETREKTYCPGCRYMYEFPDGKELPEEALGCSLHPGREYEGCEDFEDYGITKWDAYYKDHYAEINLTKGMIEQTKKEIKELEDGEEEI